MNEEIEQELKLSKKQNKNDRYNYLCSQFNGIEYAMKLEKYTNKLLKENTQLKQQLKDKNEKISEIIEYIKENIKAELLNGSIWIDKYKLLNILEGIEQESDK